MDLDDRLRLLQPSTQPLVLLSTGVGTSILDLMIPLQLALDPDRCRALISHGRFHYLPFHALENDASFLVQQTIPFYAPSLRMLQAILE